MVRYFPHANPAVHPYYPHLLDFAPANVPFTVFNCSSGTGVVIGLARYLTKDVFDQKTRGLCAMHGLFMRKGAICAVIGVPLSALIISMIQVRQAAQSGPLEYKKRVYFLNLDKIDVEDWSIRGALLGAALALLPVRCLAVNGWKRYLGAVSMGAAAGQSAYMIKHHKEFIRAWELQREYKNERRQSPEGSIGAW